MSRLDDVVKKVRRNLATVRGVIGSHDGPLSVSVPESDAEFLLAELTSQRANVSALQRKLNACRNMHKQKDDMIGRRDRSIEKAHRYIEQLKAELKKAKLKSAGKAEATVPEGEAQ